MKYHQIIKQDTANGPGVRVSLFVSGCNRNCPGCHNKKGQDFSFGEEFTDHTKETIFKEFHKFPQYYDGLSILGGEPLNQENAAQVANLVKEFKALFPEKDLWVYTGYTYELLPTTDAVCTVLENADVLVDGPFVESLKDLTLSFRGSSNQRIIDLKASLAKGKCVALSLDRQGIPIPKSNTLLVRAVWELEIDTEDLDESFIDIHRFAKDLTARELQYLLDHKEITAEDFSYELEEKRPNRPVFTDQKPELL